MTSACAARPRISRAREVREKVARLRAAEKRNHEELALAALEQGIERTMRDWSPRSPAAVAVKCAAINVKLAIRAAFAEDDQT